MKTLTSLRTTTAATCPSPRSWCHTCQMFQRETIAHHLAKVHLRRCTVAFKGCVVRQEVFRNQLTGQFHCPRCDRSYPIPSSLQRHTRLQCTRAASSAVVLPASRAPSSPLSSLPPSPEPHLERLRLPPPKRRDVSRKQRAQIRYYSTRRCPIPEIADYMRMSERTVQAVADNEMQDNLDEDSEHFEIIDALDIDAENDTGTSSRLENAELDEVDDKVDDDWSEFIDKNDVEVPNALTFAESEDSDEREESEVELALCTRISPSPELEVQEQDDAKPCSPSPIPSLLYPESNDDMELELPVDTLTVSSKSAEPLRASRSSTSLQQPTPPRSLPPDSPLEVQQEERQPASISERPVFSDPLLPERCIPIQPSRVPYFTPAQPEPPQSLSEDSPLEARQEVWRPVQVSERPVFDDPLLPERCIPMRRAYHTYFTPTQLEAPRPETARSVYVFLSHLGMNLAYLMPVFEAFGCATLEDLDVLCMSSPVDDWQFLHAWLRTRYSVDILRWYVLQAGFEARAASLRSPVPSASVPSPEASQLGGSTAVHAFLHNLRRPLSKHLVLFSACGLRDQVDLDRLCEADRAAWQQLGEELVERGLSGLEWLVVREGLTRRRQVMLS